MSALTSTGIGASYQIYGLHHDSTVNKYSYPYNNGKAIHDGAAGSQQYNKKNPTNETIQITSSKGL